MIAIIFAAICSVCGPAVGKIIIPSMTILAKRYHLEGQIANKIGSPIRKRRIAGSRFELLIYGL